MLHVVSDAMDRMLEVLCYGIGLAGRTGWPGQPHAILPIVRWTSQGAAVKRCISVETVGRCDDAGSTEIPTRLIPSKAAAA
jgi:hypothetical protein